MMSEELDKAEIAKIEAETEKLRAEISEVNARLKVRWFEGRFFVQAVVAGIVAAGLLTAWSVEYLEPILSKNSRLSAMEVDVKKHENELISLQHQISENKLKQELAEISRKNQELIIQTKKLEEIAENQLDSISDIDTQDTENSLDMLRKSRQESEDQAKQLQSALKSSFAQVCVTQTGVCPMTTPIPQNSPCYCVTAFGPVQGYSQ